MDVIYISGAHNDRVTRKGLKQHPKIIQDNPGHLLSMAESLSVSEFISYLLCQPERSLATYLLWPVFSKKDLMWGDGCRSLCSSTQL